MKLGNLVGQIPGLNLPSWNQFSIPSVPKFEIPSIHSFNIPTASDLTDTFNPLTHLPAPALPSFWDPSQFLRTEFPMNGPDGAAQLSAAELLGQIPALASANPGLAALALIVGGFATVGFGTSLYLVYQKGRAYLENRTPKTIKPAPTYSSPTEYPKQNARVNVAVGNVSSDREIQHKVPPPVEEISEKSEMDLTLGEPIGEAPLSDEFSSDVVDLDSPNKGDDIVALLGEDGARALRNDHAPQKNTPIVAQVQVEESSAPNQDPEFPQIKGFKILKELGRGGFAAVYLAKVVREDNWLETDEYVAIKVILGKNDGQYFHRRFVEEGHALKKINHPNVIALDKVGKTEDGAFYIAMRFIPGSDLHKIRHNRKQEGNKITTREAIHIVREVAVGLKALHRKKLVHRDLKPGNIMISTENWEEVPALATIIENHITSHDSSELTVMGQNILPDIPWNTIDWSSVDIAALSAVVLDLGLARRSDKDHLTQMAVGTYSYMAPEQHHADANLDARTDIYSLGAVLFTLLTDRAPYQGRKENISLQVGQDQISAVVHGSHYTPPFLEQHRNSIHPDMFELLQIMLHPDPNCRHQSAQDVIDHIDMIVAMNPDILSD